MVDSVQSSSGQRETPHGEGSEQRVSTDIYRSEYWLNSFVGTYSDPLFSGLDDLKRIESRRAALDHEVEQERIFERNWRRREQVKKERRQAVQKRRLKGRQPKPGPEAEDKEASEKKAGAGKKSRTEPADAQRRKTKSAAMVSYFEGHRLQG